MSHLLLYTNLKMLMGSLTLLVVTKGLLTFITTHLDSMCFSIVTEGGHRAQRAGTHRFGTCVC